MILPTKGISFERALATIGGQTLEILDRPRSVSSTFEALKKRRKALSLKEPVSFDWFSLALVLLYSIEAIERNSDGTLVRTKNADT